MDEKQSEKSIPSMNSIKSFDHSSLIDFLARKIPHHFDAMIYGYGLWSRYSKIYPKQMDIGANTKEALNKVIHYLQSNFNTKKITRSLFCVSTGPLIESVSIYVSIL